MKSFLRACQDNVLDNRAFDAVEKRLCSYHRLRSRQVFIVGPPRSGSTLVYQIIILAFRFSYLTNFSALMPSLPGTMTLISKSLFEPLSRLKLANYGFIKGLWSPNEGGAIMSKWFGANCSGTPEASVATIQEVMGAPFINKNTFNSGRVRNIVQRLPNAIFIHVWRDLLSNVASTYWKAKSSPQKMFGYYPKGCLESPNDDIFDREARRTIQIHGEICEAIGSQDSPVVDLTYNALCDNTHQMLRYVEEQFALFGLRLERRETALSKLEKGSKTHLLTPEESDKLKRSINNARKWCADDVWDMVAQ